MVFGDMQANFLAQTSIKKQGNMLFFIVIWYMFTQFVKYSCQNPVGFENLFKNPVGVLSEIPKLAVILSLSLSHRYLIDPSLLQTFLSLSPFPSSLSFSPC